MENLTGTAAKATSPIPYILLIYSILCYAFILVVLIICLKSKVRKKVLWCLGILIQNGLMLSHVYSGELISKTFNIQFLYFGFSKLESYTDGGYKFIFVFPVIALIFLLNKRKLALKAESYRAKKSALSEEPSSGIETVRPLNKDDLIS